MANNRMILKNRVTGEEVLLAKYYPSTGWYCYPDLPDNLNAVLESSRPEGTMWGDNDWVVEYEHDATEPSMYPEAVPVTKENER